MAEITDITPMTEERLAEIDRIGYADDHDVIGELLAEVRRARAAEHKLRATAEQPARDPLLVDAAEVQDMLKRAVTASTGAHCRRVVRDLRLLAASYLVALEARPKRPDPAEVAEAYRQACADPQPEAGPLPPGYLPDTDIELIAQHALNSDPQACRIPSSSVLPLVIMLRVARKERDWARAEQDALMPLGREYGNGYGPQHVTVRDTLYDAVHWARQHGGKVFERGLFTHGWTEFKQ